MSESKTRVAGSGWTTFTFRNQRIAWLQTIQDQAPQAVAQAVAVQALDDEHPAEIVTARAVGAGTLTLTVYELWNQEVWQTLPGLAGSRSLIEVLKNQVKLGAISCQKIIKGPNGYRTKNYYNCTITNVDESENVQIGNMVLPKTITMMYTHSKTV